MKQRGFTIVELLIVIVVIGILGAITIVAYTGISQSARVASLNSDLENAAKRLKLDQVDLGTYPATTVLANNGAGLKSSPGTTYQYTVNNSTNPQTFCLTATTGSTSYYTNNDGIPTAGACAGHTSGGGLTCATGYIVVPGSSTFSTSDFCVAKFEAKNVGGVATSEAAGAPWVSISQTSAISTAAAACSGCHLVTEAEWLTLAHNVLSVNSNWSGGTVGAGYIYNGHNDNVPANSLAADTDDNNGYSGTGQSAPSVQRRTLTLTNGEVIWDMAGNVYDLTTGTVAGSSQPGLSGESAYAWKNYNNGSLLQNGLPSSAYPSFGTPAASGWTSTQGIGQLYSNYGEAALTSFGRGGRWSSTSNAGVLALNLNSAPSNASISFGFRVAK